MKYAALTAVLLSGILWTTSGWNRPADGSAESRSVATVPDFAVSTHRTSGDVTDKSENSAAVSVGSQMLTSVSEPQTNASHTADIGLADSGHSAMANGSELEELQYDASILQLRSQLHGIARPQQNAVMSSLVPGRIMTVHVVEGATVQQGAELISLDDRLAVAQVTAAETEAAATGGIQRAELAFQQAQRQFQRLQKAALKTPTAGFEIEEVRSAMQQSEAEWTAAREAQQVAEANVQLAQQQLLRHTVSAPFAGLVVQIHQQPGVTVDPSIPLITLANLERLEAEMYVPIERFGQLKAGGKVHVQAGAPVHAELKATVKSVSPVIDSASHTFRCVLQIENPDGTLPAGFSVSLNSELLPSSDLAASTLSVRQHVPNF